MAPGCATAYHMRVLIGPRQFRKARLRLTCDDTPGRSRFSRCRFAMALVTSPWVLRLPRVAFVLLSVFVGVSCNDAHRGPTEAGDHTAEVTSLEAFPPTGSIAASA